MLGSLDSLRWKGFVGPGVYPLANKEAYFSQQACAKSRPV